MYDGPPESNLQSLAMTFNEVRRTTRKGLIGTGTGCEGASEKAIHGDTVSEIFRTKIVVSKDITLSGCWRHVESFKEYFKPPWSKEHC